MVVEQLKKKYVILILMNLGKKLKEVRKSKSLTQTVTAKQAGITQCYLSSIESDSVSPTLTTIKKLCDVYDYPVVMLYIGAVDSSTLSPDRKLLFDAGVELIEKSLI